MTVTDPTTTIRRVMVALQEVVGGAIILDERLTIVAATDEAAEIAGVALPPGVALVKLLCGEGESRPIAEALANGQAATGLVVRPAPDGGLRTIHVRTIPIGDAPREGWIVLLEPEVSASAATDDSVLFHGMWTRDPAMKRMFHVIERAARRDVSVLVRGETGTGKELVARAIHDLSPRREGPFRAINCAALPPNLLESELFGHVKGAFTGAVRDNAGIFRAAHRGTLFLDEVAEMPLDLQAKLLRVLETKTVIPVGSTDAVAVDARIVAATHQSLRAAVQAGAFRADLMYRLRVVPMFLPSLADRIGDIALLTDKLIEQLNEDGGRRITRVTAGARRALQSYRWPGNVRELRNALEYAYVIGDGPTLVDTDLPPEIGARSEQLEVNAPPALPDSTSEERRIRTALERAHGNRERAAQSLGMSRVTLWRRMKALGIADAAETADD